MEANNIFKQIALVLRDSDILMKEIEHEYNTAIGNIRFDGEEEFLHQYYKKILTSVYRMRNNAAALLLRYKCTCQLNEDEITIIIDDKKCTLSANAIKTILQDDYQKVIDKNKTERPISIVTLQNSESESVPVSEGAAQITKSDDQDAAENTEVAGQSIESDNGEKPVSLIAKPQVVEHKIINNKENRSINKTLSSKPPVKEAEPEKAKVVSKEEPDFDPFDDVMLFGEEPDRAAETIINEKHVSYMEKSEIIKTPEAFEQTKEETIEKTENNDFLFGFNDDMDDLDVPLVNIPMKTETSGANESKNEMTSDDSFFFFDDDQVDTEDSVEEEKPQRAAGVAVNLNPSDQIHLNKPETDTETDPDDFFSFVDDDSDVSENSKESQTAAPEVADKKPDKKFNDGFFTQQSDDNNVKEIEHSVKQTNGKFNLSEKEFKRQDDTSNTKEEAPVHKFTTEAVSGDTQDLLEQLKKGRAAYDKEELERKLKDAQNVKLKGNVINLSTGNIKQGDIDAEKAIGKVSSVAQDVIAASKKDRLMDARLEGNTKTARHAYEIQRDSDFVRMKNNFILDDCKVAIIVYEDGIIKSKDKVKLVIAPISIPETGTALVTDICAYMECNGEVHGAAVAPGKNSTLIIRGEDYTFLIRGSWENGNFKTAISIVGNGTEVKFKIDKKEIRPDSMAEVGIGHNVIYADHATIAHIIPVSDTNEFGEYSNFMTVLVKDYGIEQDVDCKVLNDMPEMVIKGEKYKYAVSTIWDSDILKVNFKTITR